MKKCCAVSFVACVVADWEIIPAQLKDKLDHKENITIVDVREPYEWQIANLAKGGILA
jgi:rhodanese-related sulfurtransferase